ncbi:type III pantothenate kinase [Millisia brevis]|uniref:type III pantothenate kinase n=1 Tax=Millisia brevis TaxID=264148 RepID=UPI00082F0CB8|nr:type III pantothenate kinase [Millisia brevis]
MLLAIDMRHVGTVVGLFSGKGSHASLVRRWRVRTDPAATADELSMTIRGLLGPHIESVTGIGALSTPPSVLRELRAMLAEDFGTVPSVVIGPGVRTGVPLLVDNPREVGADRIVNALAAFESCGGACIVVDVSTSICVDAVSAGGEFLGGAIAPGLQLATEALISRAGLRDVELLRPRSVVGKSSVEAVQAGAIFGFAGLVDGLVDRVRRTFADRDGDPVVIATGDQAGLIVPETSTIERHEPGLTLEGLRLAFERDRHRRR